ncbi:MAG: hypothetical protein M3323_12270 [Actinomycetota bacterium]|nr:hypothetical protein [Actinomycetota bacterium]
MDDEKREAQATNDDANDPSSAPVDGPGGAEEPGGLGSSSQGAPGEVEGGGTSGV